MHDATPQGAGARTAGAIAGVIAASLLLGAGTSFAQTVLPHALRPLANSSGGWTLLTVLLVWEARQRTTVSALLGGLSFVALVLGYQQTSILRGFDDSETLFLVIGAMVGPFLGVAASWLRAHEVRPALGAGLIAGILFGDALFGLLVVVATTGWLAWALLGVTGVALLAVVLRRRVGSGQAALVGIGTAVVVPAAYLLAYTLVGGVAG